jgi:hypothetical protein
MTTLRHHLLRASATTAALVFAWLPLPAAAQPGSPDQATAEALFQDARTLMHEGRIEEACGKFAGSLKIEPKLGTLLNLALCHEKQGLTATAWGEFTTAATRARARGADQRLEFAEAHRDMLAARLSRVRLQKPTRPIASLAITIDGTPLDAAAFDTALPVDPGTHVIVFSAPGKVAATLSINVSPGPSEVHVPVPELRDEVPVLPVPVAPRPAPVARPQLAPVAPSRAPLRAPIPPDEPNEGYSPLVYVGFGIGGAGLLVGAITGAITLSKGGDVDEICPNARCTPEGRAKIDDATVVANVSNVAFGVAGVGVALGLVGIAISGDGASDDVALHVTPRGMTLRGSF